MSGQTFVVKILPVEGGTPFIWWPDGEQDRCSADAARKRFEHALALGAKGEPIEDGLVPWRVSIERDDAPQPSPVPSLAHPLTNLQAGLEGPASPRVVLSQYVLDKAPTGPWAQENN